MKETKKLGGRKRGGEDGWDREGRKREEEREGYIKMAFWNVAGLGNTDNRYR